MTTIMADLDTIKDIPGYKAILKSVIKSQIQLLVEQLCESTDEESVMLTANLNDGGLSHLGSNTGKVFLDGRDEFKSQFLGFCLKRHHHRKDNLARPTPYQRPDTAKRMNPASQIHPSPSKQTKLLPTPVMVTPIATQRPSATDSVPPGGLMILSSDTPPLENMSGLTTSCGISAMNRDINKNNSHDCKTSATEKDKIVKFEMSQYQNRDNSNSKLSNFAASAPELPPPLELSRAKSTTSDDGIIAISVNLDEDSNTDTNDMTPGQVGMSQDGASSDPDNEDSNSATSIKIEPITENDMELEITGVEPGPRTQVHSVTHTRSVTSDTWGQGQMVYGTPETEGDEEAYNQSADTSGYSKGQEAANDDDDEQDDKQTSSDMDIQTSQTLEGMGHQEGVEAMEVTEKQQTPMATKKQLREVTKEQLAMPIKEQPIEVTNEQLAMPTKEQATEEVTNEQPILKIQEPPTPGSSRKRLSCEEDMDTVSNKKRATGTTETGSVDNSLATVTSSLKKQPTISAMQERETLIGEKEATPDVVAMAHQPTVSPMEQPSTMSSEEKQITTMSPIERATMSSEERRVAVSTIGQQAATGSVEKHFAMDHKATDSIVEQSMVVNENQPETGATNKQPETQSTIEQQPTESRLDEQPVLNEIDLTMEEESDDDYEEISLSNQQHMLCNKPVPSYKPVISNQQALSSNDPIVISSQPETSNQLESNNQQQDLSNQSDPINTQQVLSNSQRGIRNRESVPSKQSEAFNQPVSSYADSLHPAVTSRPNITSEIHQSQYPELNFKIIDVCSLSTMTPTSKAAGILLPRFSNEARTVRDTTQPSDSNKSQDSSHIIRIPSKSQTTSADSNKIKPSQGFVTLPPDIVPVPSVSLYQHTVANQTSFGVSAGMKSLLTGGRYAKPAIEVVKQKCVYKTSASGTAIPAYVRIIPSSTQVNMATPVAMQSTVPRQSQVATQTQVGRQSQVAMQSQLSMSTQLTQVTMPSHFTMPTQSTKVPIMIMDIDKGCVKQVYATPEASGVGTSRTVNAVPGVVPGTIGTLPAVRPMSFGVGSSESNTLRPVSFGVGPGVMKNVPSSVRPVSFGIGPGIVNSGPSSIRPVGVGTGLVNILPSSATPVGFGFGPGIVKTVSSSALPSVRPVGIGFGPGVVQTVSSTNLPAVRPMAVRVGPGVKVKAVPSTLTPVKPLAGPTPAVIRLACRVITVSSATGSGSASSSTVAVSTPVSQGTSLSDDPCSADSVFHSALLDDGGKFVNYYNDDTDSASAADDDADKDYIELDDDSDYDEDSGTDEKGGTTTIRESYCSDPSQPMLESIPIDPNKYVKFNKVLYGRDKTRIVLKKHICQVCGKRLLKKSDLDRHARIHTGERPYTCPGCSQTFSQHQYLVSHRRRTKH